MTVDDLRVRKSVYMLFGQHFQIGSHFLKDWKKKDIDGIIPEIFYTYPLLLLFIIITYIE